MANQSLEFMALGLGYVARALLAHIEQAGANMRGSGRVQGGWTDDTIAPLLEGKTHLLISASPDQLLNSELMLWLGQAAKKQQLSWVGYLSTTGVYGDADGAWVDETSPLLGATPRLKARKEAERMVLDALPHAAHIFRLSGIYGEGRNALEQVMAGTARRIIKDNHVFSRIHVEDIARVLWASANAPSAGEIFNVTDDCPAPAHAVVEYASALLNMPAPLAEPYDGAAISGMMREFYAANRRVSNAKLKKHFGMELAYPDYKAGLTGLLSNKNNGS